MVNIYHELGHALISRQLGYAINKFELELAEDYFGEVGHPEGEAPREHIVLIAFAGPLAEVRFVGQGRHIDKNKSIAALANALPGPPGVAVFYEGEEEPILFGKEVFGTDWGVVNAQFDAAVADNPMLDRDATYLALLGQAIDWVNEGENWGIIESVASDLMEDENVKGLEAGGKIDIPGTVQALIDAHLPPPADPHG